jgi:hypothetical protein
MLGKVSASPVIGKPFKLRMNSTIELTDTHTRKPRRAVQPQVKMVPTIEPAKGGQTPPALVTHL